MYVVSHFFFQLMIAIVIKWLEFRDGIFSEGELEEPIRNPVKGDLRAKGQPMRIDELRY